MSPDALFDTPSPEVTHAQAGGLAKVSIEGVGAVVPPRDEPDRDPRVADRRGRAGVAAIA